MILKLHIIFKFLKWLDQLNVIWTASPFLVLRFSGGSGFVKKSESGLYKK